MGAILAVVLASSSVALPQGQPAEPSADPISVLLRLQRRLVVAFSYLQAPEELRDVTVVEGSWQYSYRRGLQYVRPGVGIPTPEYVVTDGIAEERRVLSKPGYRKVEGTINLGTATGIGTGEAAYNYFGIKRTGYFDFEGGVYRYGPSPNWFVFHALNGQTVPDGWPIGGMAPGTNVFFRVYVAIPNRVVFFVSYSPPGSLAPIGRTWEYDARGLDPEGKDQRIRRNTSLLLDSGPGSALNNHWSGVLAGTPASLHLWVPADTGTKVATPGVIPGPNAIPDHNESVSINVN